VASNAVVEIIGTLITLSNGEGRVTSYNRANTFNTMSNVLAKHLNIMSCAAYRFFPDEQTSPPPPVIIF